MVTCAIPNALQRFRDIFLRHAPPIHARMTDPGYVAKYLREPFPITDADLDAHLAGEITLACVLQRDGHSTVAACDLDSGGEPALRQVLRAAEAWGCHAYGFSMRGDTHNGGHVWICFEHAHPAADLQALMRDILANAGVACSEVYPSYADLRLPFGVHRRTGTRGNLLLNSAAPAISIDADPTEALAMFLDTYQETGDAPVARARAAQAARKLALETELAQARALEPRPSNGQRTGLDVIRAFNATTDMIALLESYGAQLAHRYADGTALLHCASSQDHSNGDKHPSLIVQSGTGRQSGKMICGCFSPNCRLHNNPNQVKDAFEVFCILEGIDRREGVRRLGGVRGQGSGVRGRELGFEGRELGFGGQGSGVGNQYIENQRIAASLGREQKTVAASFTPPSREQQTIFVAPTNNQELITGTLSPNTQSLVPSTQSLTSNLQSSIFQSSNAASNLQSSNPATTITLAPTDIVTDWRHDIHARAKQLRADQRSRPMDERLFGFFVEQCRTGPTCRPSNAAAAAALGTSEDTIKYTKRRLVALGYIKVTVSTDGRSTSVVDLLPAQEAGGVIARSPESKLGIGLTKKGGGDHPPAITPPAELTSASEPAAEEAAPEQPAAPRPITKREYYEQRRQKLSDYSVQELQQKRHVLLAMVNKAVNERQRFAFNCQVAEIDSELEQRRNPGLQALGLGSALAAASPAEESSLLCLGPAQPAALSAPAPSQPAALSATEIPQLAALSAPSPSAISLASPTDPHPPLGDAQLTAVLRRGLRERLSPRHRRLIDTIGVQQRGNTLLFVCPPQQAISAVESIVAPVVPYVLADAGLPAWRVCVVSGFVSSTPQGPPLGLPSQLWASLPVSVRAALVGATLVGNQLYGATPTLTEVLAEDITGGVAFVLEWLSEVMQDVEGSVVLVCPAITEMPLFPHPDT